MVLVVTANEENASNKKIGDLVRVPYSWKTGFATKKGSAIKINQSF